MNLLIVDDEEITREGITQQLPWSELGIDQIQQADDGVNALRIVEKFKPDIVLTDVRMPRMDGIQMSFKLKELFPHCTIVFMSGYSDKEYLKAAIQLKAVDYVDKPINIRELKSAVENAVTRAQESQLKVHTEFVAETYMKVGIPLLRSELAISILNKDMDTQLIMEQAKAAYVELPSDGFFDTVIIKFILNEEHSSEHLSSIKSIILSSLENAYPKYGINEFSGFKNDDFLILHLFVQSFEKHLLTEDKLYKFFNGITASLNNKCSFIISVGKTVHGLTNIQDSYNTAVSGLERAFFKEYNNILFYDRTIGSQYSFDTIHIKDFLELVEGEKREESILYIKSLISTLRRYENTPVNSIKNFFYSILLEVCKISHQKGFDLLECNTGENQLWEIFLKFYTLSEIEEFMIKNLKTFFEASSQKSKNYNLIDKIYKYVQNHYSDSDLSIDRISEHTHFAPTYICAVFKEKTGKTLNHYITEYRIEKSKEFLRDLNLKVSDIASKVGCSDSGYFTKLFRKTTGITPSEYRERLIP